LKKAPSDERAVLPRASDRTKAFVKAWTRLTHSGRFDIKRLKQATELLVANDSPLGPKWLDHALVGEWVDHREYHIGRDFLLIYRLQGGGAGEEIIFVRAGTHAELFE
jgi:mRNA interferase YafQ